MIALLICFPLGHIGGKGVAVGGQDIGPLLGQFIFDCQSTSLQNVERGQKVSGMRNFARFAFKRADLVVMVRKPGSSNVFARPYGG